RCVSMKPGRTIFPDASTTCASPTSSPGPTSTIFPSSTRTSAFGISPTSGSIDTTNPPRQTRRSLTGSSSVKHSFTVFSEIRPDPALLGQQPATVHIEVDAVDRLVVEQEQHGVGDVVHAGQAPTRRPLDERVQHLCRLPAPSRAVPHDAGVD